MEPRIHYRTIKIQLKDFIKNDDDEFNILNEKVVLCNNLMIHVYQFIRLYLLKLYDENKEIPEITSDIVKSCFTVLAKKTKGKQQTSTSLNLLSELKKFYTDEYRHLYYSDEQKIDKESLSQVISIFQLKLLLV